MSIINLVEPILSEREASALLHVSTPFLVKQLENGKLPYRKVGRLRRIEFEKFLEFRQSMHRDTEQALQELVGKLRRHLCPPTPRRLREKTFLMRWRVILIQATNQFLKVKASARTLNEVSAE